MAAPIPDTPQNSQRYPSNELHEPTPPLRVKHLTERDQ